MNADWTHNSRSLPSEGQQIAFVLDHRNAPLVGTYSRQAFRSRWAEYGVDRVHRWRDLALGCDHGHSGRIDAAGALSRTPRQCKSREPLSGSGVAHAA